jgi:hypothetical protein
MNASKFSDAQKAFVLKQGANTIPELRSATIRHWIYSQ